MTYKRVTLYQIMTKLHSILTKVIPICTFGKTFTNSNPKIKNLVIFRFFTPRAVENSIKLFLKCLGSRENVKTKVSHQIG